MSRESKIIVVITGILFAIGLITIFSATGITAAESEKFASPYYFLYRQLLWALIAVTGMIVAARISYKTWQKFAVPLLIVGLVLLAVVLVPGIGAKINGARRWFRVGPLSFQPSELAKYLLLIFIAAYAARNPDRLKRFKAGVLPCFGVIALTCAVVIVEPDIGSALFTGLVATIVLIIAGARIAHLAPLFACGLVPVVFLVVTKMGYIMSRLAVYMDPDLDPTGKGYHIKQSLLALGSGGLFGTGLGEGMAKLFYLPETQSDFIFAVVGEEMGFFGSLLVIGLFVAFLVTAWRICRRTTDLFGFLLAAGITISIVLQAAINLAVVTGSIPTKGIPLPFISFGGSSLIMTMFAAGILINIANTAPSEVPVATTEPSISPPVSV